MSHVAAVGLRQAAKPSTLHPSIGLIFSVFLSRDSEWQLNPPSDVFTATP